MSRGQIEEWLDAMVKTSICGLGQGAPFPMRNAFRYWPDLFAPLGEPRETRRALSVRRAEYSGPDRPRLARSGYPGTARVLGRARRVTARPLLPVGAGLAADRVEILVALGRDSPQLRVRARSRGEMRQRVLAPPRLAS